MLKYICPLLVVENIARSRSFYERVFGLKVVADFGENVTFDAGFSIHLLTHFQGLIDGKTIHRGSNAMELYFETDCPEDILKTLQDENVEFVHLLREQPWQQRVVRFYDPDKHIIEVGESMENVCIRLFQSGMSVETVCQKTYMPMPFVEAAFGKQSQM